MVNVGNAIARMSVDLEQGDFAEQDRLAGEDHAAHATRTTCSRCGRVIEPGETARLRGPGAGEWVHDMCPAGGD